MNAPWIRLLVLALLATSMLCVGVPASAQPRYKLESLVEGKRKITGFRDLDSCLRGYQLTRRQGGNPSITLTQAGYDALTDSQALTLALLLSMGGRVVFEPEARCGRHAGMVAPCTNFCLQLDVIAPRPQMPVPQPPPREVIIHPQPVPVRATFHFGRGGDPHPRPAPAVDEPPAEEGPYAAQAGGAAAAAAAAAAVPVQGPEEGPFAAAPSTFFFPPPPPLPPPFPFPPPVQVAVLPAPPSLEVPQPQPHPLPAVQLEQPAQPPADAIPLSLPLPLDVNDSDSVFFLEPYPDLILTPDQNPGFGPIWPHPSRW